MESSKNRWERTTGQRPASLRSPVAAGSLCSPAKAGLATPAGRRRASFHRAAMAALSSCRAACHATSAASLAHTRERHRAHPYGCTKRFAYRPSKVSGLTESPQLRAALRASAASTPAARSTASVCSPRAGAPPRIERRVRHLDRRPQRMEPAERGVVYLHCHLPSDDLRIGKDLRIVVDGSARDASLLETLQPFRRA